MVCINLTHAALVSFVFSLDGCVDNESNSQNSNDQLDTYVSCLTFVVWLYTEALCILFYSVHMGSWKISQCQKCSCISQGNFMKFALCTDL